MMKKYIIVSGRPVLFSIEIIHAEMVTSIFEVESAGFFFIINDREKQKFNIICMGESTSLSVCSRPEIDQKIIADFLELDTCMTH